MSAALYILWLGILWLISKLGGAIDAGQASSYINSYFLQTYDSLYASLTILQ